MNEKLKNELLNYYGELLYDKQNCHDWIGISNISDKLTAIETLLELPEVERVTFLDKIKKLF